MLATGVFLQKWLMSSKSSHVYVFKDHLIQLKFCSLAYVSLQSYQLLMKLFFIQKPVRTTGNDSRSQENSLESDAIKGSLSNMDICNKVDLPTYMVSCQDKIGVVDGKRQTEALKEKVETIGSQCPAPSPCVLESPGLHNEFSLDDELDEGETRSSEPITGNEQLSSSCASVAMKPLRAHREDLSSSDPLHKNDIMTKRSSSLIEASKILQTKQTDHRNLKVYSDVYLESYVISVNMITSKWCFFHSWISTYLTYVLIELK